MDGIQLHVSKKAVANSKNEKKKYKRLQANENDSNIPTSMKYNQC